MTPEQKLKHLILTTIAQWRESPLPVFDAATIDGDYGDADEDDLQDAGNEIRSSGIETGLPAPSSRHYEGDEVAAQSPDGSWVGWTYWHGGGKHGEPEAIDWIGSAYDITCVEEEKVVTVRTFSKVPA